MKSNFSSKKISLVVLLPLLVALATLIGFEGTSLAASFPNQPIKEQYQNRPLTVSGVTIPEVMLVVSKDLKMFQQGYPALVDLDGDGRVDTGFNPMVEYVGYFDSNSCYAYSGSTYKGLNGTYYAYGDAAGYFYRVGQAIEDQTEREIANSRPSSLKDYVVSPRSGFGVCYNPTTSAKVGSGSVRAFSGNWLNFIATSRMDAIRKILYGGKRSVDTTARTVLEGSFVPPDSTLWGTEVRSDDTWMEVTPLSAYYDVRKFTPFDKPVSKKAHFIARGSDLGSANKHFPALRVLQNADKSSFNIGGTDYVNESVTVTEPYARYWDWVLINRPLPDDKVLKSNVNRTIQIYNIHVEVCQTGNIGETEGCERFPGATSAETDDVWKPRGLLQRYGQGSTMMYFGLLTGGFGNYDAHKEGGILRNHIGPVMGKTPSNVSTQYVPAIDIQTGQVLANGLIKNLDNLMIAGRPINSNPLDAQFYKNHKSWGNPIGEMYFEAVRYLGGLTTPTQSYSKETESDESGSTNNNLTRFAYATNAWNSRKPGILASDCVQPVILLISDVASSYDGNSFNTDLSRPLIPGTTLPSGTNLPQSFNYKTYLDSMTKIEGLNTTGQVNYIYSSASQNFCGPKSLSSLTDVSGICPELPSAQGTYSVAAAAYYAHIRDFNLSTSENKVPNGVNTFAVSMSSAFPQLTFNVSDSKSVTIMPTNITAGASGKFLGFLNYFVLEWDSDRNGMTFHAKIKVNFSDQEMGDDWEGDGQITYEIDLLTDATTPANMRGSTKVGLDSGELRAGTYYVFKNPATANSKEDFIEIRPDQVKAIRVASSWQTTGTGLGMAMGYNISGTTRDNTYLDLTMNAPPASNNLTPRDCPYVGGSTSGTYGCGKRITSLKSQARIFAFGTDKNVENLPSTMWMAAKYGGFNDVNRNGIPDPGEWENTDGTPRNFFQAKNLSELASKMENAFVAIARSISTGTATSASTNTVLGGGISLNTAYYPQYVNPQNNAEKLAWVGTVYGLFVDKWDNLREDTNGDGKLTLATGSGQGDYVVTFNSVSNTLPEADQPNCYIEGIAITRCGDTFGTGKLEPLPLPDGAPTNIHKLKTVWDAGRWLAELDPTGANLLAGSRNYATAATKTQGKRLIYFSYPGSNTLTPFNNSAQSTAILNKYLLHDNYASNLVVPANTQNTKAAMTAKLINYVQGAEVPGWRTRTVDNPWGGTPAKVIWRLGDVINSKPIVVGAPSSNFDILYGSSSYLRYRTEAGTRRQVAYFGANDGMLHAINLGFYGSIAIGQVGYNLIQRGANHDLGAEMWAYIPASILPHLQWLADPNYTHAFTVDLKPLLVDIKIDGEWRTVIIGGLRLGGRPIENPNSGSGEGPFYSEIFCLDVTDPESAPKFLWRYSSRELGLTVGMPTVVASNGKFYAVLPSGPVTDTVDASGGINYGTNSPYDGYSDQRARLIVLDAATGVEINTGTNLYVAAEDGKSFFNEPFMPIAQDADKTDDVWNNYAVYYGLTISRDPSTCLDRGAVYRLRTVDKSTYAPLLPTQWQLERFVSTDRPVTGAVNGTYDNLGQLWIYFATGRLWGIEDLTPCSSINTTQCVENHEQYLYGIKEQTDSATGRLLFTDRTPVVNSLFDVTGIQVFSNGYVKMSDGVTVQNYGALAQAIKNPSVPGYKRKLDMSRILFPNQTHSFELNFYQPKLVGLGNGKSLISFTTFEPKSVASFCGELGSSYLYILDSFTGLASPDLYSIFSSETPIPFDQEGTAFLVTGGTFTSNQLNTEVTISYTDHVSIKTKTVENEEFKKELPLGYNEVSSVISWREAVNTGFTLSEDAMTLDLQTLGSGTNP
ncbi:MAG: hypothetical protein LBF58_04705 [Deltaproteobacteria bacterium]|jgi:type IV pilus assembly protein PilY1|nr:hypothetical protein [Deltaproteobacteria bacterium]